MFSQLWHPTQGGESRANGIPSPFPHSSHLLPPLYIVLQVKHTLLIPALSPSNQSINLVMTFITGITPLLGGYRP